MRRNRNPRRAYDEEGREIAPPTVGSARAQGETTIAAHCQDCHHHAIISTDGLPADLPIPDIAFRLRCSACGNRRIGVMMDMEAHYARLTAETGWKMDPRPWPKAEPETKEPRSATAGGAEGGVSGVR